MTASQDTEITLGTGRMVGLFFGLVAVCAIFFGMGFSLGKSSAKIQNGEVRDGDAPASVVSTSPKRPSAGNSAVNSQPPPDMTFYKSVQQNHPDTALASTAENISETKPNVPDPAIAPIGNGYFVQVAAVSKQEDADALVDALKKKQYPAVAAQTPGDKLFHVQVGPFSAIKEAETMRAQLLADGYNPILKK